MGARLHPHLHPHRRVVSHATRRRAERPPPARADPRKMTRDLTAKGLSTSHRPRSWQPDSTRRTTPRSRPMLLTWRSSGAGPCPPPGTPRCSQMTRTQSHSSTTGIGRGVEQLHRRSSRLPQRTRRTITRAAPARVVAAKEVAAAAAPAHQQLLGEPHRAPARQSPHQPHLLQERQGRTMATTSKPSLPTRVPQVAKEARPSLRVAAQRNQPAMSLCRPLQRRPWPQAEPSGQTRPRCDRRPMTMLPSLLQRQLQPPTPTRLRPLVRWRCRHDFSRFDIAPKFQPADHFVSTATRRIAEPLPVAVTRRGAETIDATARSLGTIAPFITASAVRVNYGF